MAHVSWPFYRGSFHDHRRGWLCPIYWSILIAQRHPPHTLSRTLTPQENRPISPSQSPLHVPAQRRGITLDRDAQLPGRPGTWGHHGQPRRGAITGWLPLPAPDAALRVGARVGARPGTGLETAAAAAGRDREAKWGDGPSQRARPL